MGRRRREAGGPEGLLVVDKPLGMTSFDVIRQLRRPLNTSAIGHTGTLDPAASGVLCVAFGFTTKLLQYMPDDHKVYRAQVRLGQQTDTDDAEGVVIRERPVDIDRVQVESALAELIGLIQQVPPTYSAIKKAGRRAYDMARKGIPVQLDARTVRIDAIDLESFSGHELSLHVTCGKGTYIRSLARDLGEMLGCGAHLTGLRRLASGDYDIERAIPLETVIASAEAGRDLPWIRSVEVLSHLPKLTLTAEQVDKIRMGQFLETPDMLDALAEEALLLLTSDEDGRLLAVAKIVRPMNRRLIRPIKGRPNET